MLRYLETKNNPTTVAESYLKIKPKEAQQSTVEGYTPIFNLSLVGATEKVMTAPVQVPYSGESKRYTDANEFIADLLPVYEKELEKKGIDKSFAPYLVAQDALETGWGRAYKGNYNFGNITVGSSGASYTEGKDKDAEGNEIIQKFRNFNSLEEYASNKIALLNSKRYRAFDKGLDNFYSRIKAGGYAQDKQYIQKLNRVLSSVLNRISYS